MNALLNRGVGVVVVTIVSVLLTSVVGCSKKEGEDRPTEEEGKGAILNKIKASDEDRAIKLVNYRKTNGLLMEYGMGKVYQLEFECDIEFTHDSVWTSYLGDWKGEHGQGSFLTYPNAAPRDRDIRVQKGQRAKVIGSINFQKTDNGWRAIK